MDELRCTGKSPTDMANQVNELMHVKYERAHLAYLQAIESLWDSECGVHGQKTLGQFVKIDNTPHQFSHYQDPNGWCGVTLSGFYLTDCLRESTDVRNLLFPDSSRAHSGRSLGLIRPGRLLVKSLASGTMSSYAVMNENWLIVSWVMVLRDPWSPCTRGWLRGTPKPELKRKASTGSTGEKNNFFFFHCI